MLPLQLLPLPQRTVTMTVNPKTANVATLHDRDDGTVYMFVSRRLAKHCMHETKHFYIKTQAMTEGTAHTSARSD